MPPPPLVYLVEDDSAVRDSLVWLFRKEGYDVEAYGTPAEILSAYDQSKHGCLVLDLRLPEMTGIELRQKLIEQGCTHPFIIITGHGDVPDATRSMRMGAIDFIEKPLDITLLLSRVREAIEADLRQRREIMEHESFRSRFETLSPREREVLELVVAGKLTKQIANQLEISIKTVEVHRSNITRKMKVDNFIQLVRLYTEHQAN